MQFNENYYKLISYSCKSISSSLNMLNNTKKLRFFSLLVIQCLIHESHCADIDVDLVIATYEEVDDAPYHPEQYLIDLRSIERIAKDGSIPGSVIIPFDELEEALNMDNDEFHKKYAFEKPPKDASIIFICLGCRILARLANNMAKEKGWLRCKAYVGSWLAWIEARKWD